MNDRQKVVRHIAALIDSLNLDHPTRVGIDGVDAAGKTTLADELADWLSDSGRAVIRASIDGFHNPSAVRRQRGPILLRVTFMIRSTTAHFAQFFSTPSAQADHSAFDAPSSTSELIPR